MDYAARAKGVAATAAPWRSEDCRQRWSASGLAAERAVENRRLQETVRRNRNSAQRAHPIMPRPGAIHPLVALPAWNTASASHGKDRALAPVSTSEISASPGEHKMFQALPSPRPAQPVTAQTERTKAAIAAASKNLLIMADP